MLNRLKKRVDACAAVVKARQEFELAISPLEYGRIVIFEPGTRAIINARMFGFGFFQPMLWLMRRNDRFRVMLKRIVLARIGKEDDGVDLFKGDFFLLEIPKEFHNAKNVLLNDLAELFYLNTYTSRMPFGGDIRSGETVLDCGANIGAFSIWAATRDTSIRVIAFEPDELIAAALHRNITRNSLENRIVVENVCLGDRSGEVELFRDEEVFTVTRMAATTVDSSRTGVSSMVPVRTIDSVVAARNLDRVDWIKMDIEGAERLALKGAAETIRRFRPRLSLSGYHLADDVYVLCKGILDICPLYDIVVSNALEIYAAVPPERS